MSEVRAFLPTQPKTLLSVQIARGVAASVVVLAHANLLIAPHLFDGWFITGWSGVDFFFVLSGFIIFYVNHRDIGRPEQLRLYLYKRFIRVYPVYWIYTTATLVLNVCALLVFHHPIISWIKITLPNLARCATLLPTNTAANEMPFVPVAWTLTFEVLFYAMFSVLIGLKRSFSLPVVGLWATACLIQAVIAHPFQSLFLRVLFAPRNSEFIFGAAIAYFNIRSTRLLRPVYLWPIFSCGIILLAWTWSAAHYDAQRILANTAHNFGIAFALIVFAFVGMERQRAFKPGRIRDALVFLGDASYSIYLIHFALIVVAGVAMRRAAFIGPAWQFTLASTVSVAAGCLAYRYLERPLLQALNDQFKGRFSPKVTSLTANPCAPVAQH